MEAEAIKEPGETDKRAWLKDLNDKNHGLHDLTDVRYAAMICNYHLIREQKALELLCDTIRETIAPKLQAAINDFKRINVKFADVYIKIANLEEKICRRKR